MHGTNLYGARSGSHLGLEGFLDISSLLAARSSVSEAGVTFTPCPQPSPFKRLCVWLDKDKKKQLSTPVPCLLAFISVIFTLDQRNAATCLSACSSSLPRRVEKVSNVFRSESVPTPRREESVAVGSSCPSQRMSGVSCCFISFHIAWPLASLACWKTWRG